MEQHFLQLLELEKQNIHGALVDSNGFLRYNKNMPEYEEELSFLREKENDILFTVSRVGDILLDIKIDGEYEYAEFFQYDFLDRKISYWSGRDICKPFVDGILLGQIGKNLYLQVYNSKDVTVNGTFALLDSESRRKVLQWEDKSHGVKLEHVNGKKYQIYYTSDIGHSPNCIYPID